MRFLYWNLNRKPIQSLVTALAHDHDLDVIILSECTFSLPEFLFEINEAITPKYGLSYSPIPNPDPVIFIRLPRKSLRIVRDDPPRISIRRLVPPVGPDILIVAVHLPSKLHRSADDQTLFSTRLARVIDSEEKKVGHRRTVIVGDLNMNPFESGVVGAEGLHAVMDQRVAQKISRVVDGEERFFFYNPMWSYFGDYPSGPSGTYFYRGSQVSFFWNMFDQVIIRPALLEFFDQGSLRILTRAGSTDLLNSAGVPDKKVSSDHLPIVFSLELAKGV